MRELEQQHRDTIERVHADGRRPSGPEIWGMILQRLEEAARGNDRGVQPRQVNQQIYSIGGQNQTGICNIVANEGDVDHCV